MTFVVEDLHPEVRQIVPREIDSALVPIQQADGAIRPDADVGRARVTVDHGQGHIDEALEHCENLVDDFGWHPIEICIDAPAERPKFTDERAARSLVVACGFAMKSNELVGDEVPVSRRGRFAPVEPSLDHDAVDRTTAVAGWHNGRHTEAGLTELLQQIQLPGE